MAEAVQGQEAGARGGASAGPTIGIRTSIPAITKTGLRTTSPGVLLPVYTRQYGPRWSFIYSSEQNIVAVLFKFLLLFRVR